MRVSSRLWKSIGVTGVAIAAIAGFEGYRSAAYDDGVGVQTIGFGTTQYEDGTSVKPGDRVDPVRAVVVLQANANKIAREVAECIGDVPLAEYEWNAIVSWAYNVGAKAACNSSLVKKLKQNPPDYSGACRELLRWVYAGGRELPGLVKRREKEYRMCMGLDQ